MRTARRCVQRKRPGGISYFEFEAGSGGIVLDASEKGLGFQTADEVHQLGPSRIWISPRPEERIELTGDVVWMDRSKKTGGLRFIESGVESSRRLRNWLGQAGETELSAQSQGLPVPAWAARDLGDLRSETRHDANPPHLPVAARIKTKVDEARPGELHPIPGLPSLFTSSMPWQAQDSQTSEGRIAYRIATGFLIVVLAVAGVVLFDMFRPNVGELLIDLGERINGSAKVQPQNSSPQPRPAQAAGQPLPSSEPRADMVQTEAKPNVVQKENPGGFSLPADSSKQVNPQNPGSATLRTTPTTKEAPAVRRIGGLRMQGKTEARRLCVFGPRSLQVILRRKLIWRDST